MAAKRAKATKGEAKPETLSLRALNRATLARQFLLAREKNAVTVLERLVGMQAQWPKPPFVGLFSRVAPFVRADLVQLAQGKKVVRATMMRGTIHLASAKDFVALRPAIQPVLSRGMRTVLRDRLKGIDLETLVAEGRAYFEEKPRTFTELRDHLMTLHPKGDERALGFSVRMMLPLVLVPHEGKGAGDDGWGYRADADFAVAESWLGKKIDLADDAPDALILRYLAGYGPATVGDAQAWSGLQTLAPVFARLRSTLVTFRDEKKRELFDLPDAPRPAEDTPAPVRFLPEFDNVVVSRTDARFVPLAHRKKVFLSGLRVAPTVLLDGFVAATWSVARKKGTVTVQVSLFEGAPAKKLAAEIEAEGARIGKFIEPDAEVVNIVIARG